MTNNNESTPSWSNLVTLMCDLLENPETSLIIKMTIRNEFKRMAEGADKYQDIAKAMNC